MVAVNETIQTLISELPNTQYIDTGNALMSKGEPNPDNYVFDRLHLSAEGYDLWAEIIQSRLFSDLNLPYAAGDVICNFSAGCSLNCMLARR